MRERKLTEEREELVKRLQEKVRELEQVRQGSEGRVEKLTSNKEASERQLNSIIDTLRKQHSEAEQYYVKRIQELETGLKELEGKLLNKDNELANARQELYQIKTGGKKEDDRNLKIMDALQETNRTLTSQLL